MARARERGMERGMARETCTTEVGTCNRDSFAAADGHYAEYDNGSIFLIMAILIVVLVGGVLAIFYIIERPTIIHERNESKKWVVADKDTKYYEEDEYSDEDEDDEEDDDEDDEDEYEEKRSKPKDNKTAWERATFNRYRKARHA